MEKLNIVYMGTPDFSVGPLEKLIEKYNVVMVVTQPDKEIGRKKEIKFSPVKECAIKNNIKVFQPSKIRENYKEILDEKPDIIITCAYGQIIPKELLDYPKYGCINIHASLLPKLRGGAPIHKAIINGYEKTGVTIMYMDEKMDSGDIIYQEKIEIKDDDNAGTLFDKLSDLGMGTEKLQEYITKIFPKAKVIRMDVDTTTKKGAHEKIIRDFQEKKANILVGTQMISKGHDISNVTLVGILGVDNMLAMNDYMASEKAYSNISQVAGRAGRGDLSGRVIYL